MKRINLISLITLLFFSCSKNKEEVSPDLKGGTEYTE
jgi:PBP1b-binding outer membrane lipoprotein LpoB